MSVKKFKFVSPGVFINEIDNSFLPKEAPAIGPVVIGRSQRGIAMTPIRVNSYSQFVEMFGVRHICRKGFHECRGSASYICAPSRKQVS